MNTTHADAEHQRRRRAAQLNGRLRRHDQAVIEAEVKRLISTVRPYGVLHRQTLEHTAGAGSWREGGFDRALETAVDQGQLERLPFGYYRENTKHRGAMKA